MRYGFILALLFSTTAWAQTVPHYLNFQSIVPDDNGNLIKDPFVDMNFKILDSQGNLLYQEDQKSVQVIKSMVNVTIGEGTVPNSNPPSPTGGIPRDVFDPAEGAHFLRVTVGNNSPMDDMELMTVPYSVWSERALSIVPNSIGTEEIKDGSIKLEDLEPGLAFSNISGTVSESQLPTTLATDIELTAHVSSSTAHRASQITVRGPYLATDPTNVEDVLQALDRRIMNFYMNQNEFREDTQDALQTNIDAEETTRATADTGLQAEIDTEETTRTTADSSLQTNLDAEEAAREAAISAEASARSAADTTEASARTSADAALQSNIDAEESARSSADNTLQANINGEASARSLADSILQTSIDGEAITRANADSTLQSDINTVSSTLTSHTSNRSNPHGVTIGQIGAAAASHGHDHSDLSGLGDDDHTQYIRVDGARGFTGAQDHGGQRITNVGNATEQTDAATLRQVLVYSLIFH